MTVEVSPLMKAKVSATVSVHTEEVVWLRKGGSLLYPPPPNQGKEERGTHFKKT